GEDLSGKRILLWTEQGLGDTIQFIRFASELKARGATVFVECERSLVTLLAQCPRIDRVIRRSQRLPDFDFHSPLLGLLRVLKTTLNTIPANVPYLSSDPGLVALWREKLREMSGFRVGINWRGGAGRDGSRHRDVPFDYFIPLNQIPGARVISLQG